MNKKILFSICVFVVVILGGILIFHHMYKRQAYPFVVTLEDKSKETIQIYPGSWTDTGGSAFDSSGRLQIKKDGKVENIPMTIEQQSNTSGSVTFMLPPGHYFVYIPNPIYDDDLPRDITIPTDMSIIVSGDHH